jgi:hypothetical protein
MSRLDDEKTQRQQKRLSRGAPAIFEIGEFDPGNPCSNCSQRPGANKKQLTAIDLEQRNRPRHGINCC